MVGVFPRKIADSDTMKKVLKPSILPQKDVFNPINCKNVSQHNINHFL